MPDYREILRKYMLIVVEAEGVAFIRREYGKPSVMTEEEWEALLEVYEENYA